MATWARLKATLPARCGSRLRGSVDQRSGKRRSTAAIAGISRPTAKLLVSSQTRGSHIGRASPARRASITLTVVLNTSCTSSTVTQKPTSAWRRQGW
jgi:hypothetical protein